MILNGDKTLNHKEYCGKYINHPQRIVGDQIIILFDDTEPKITNSIKHLTKGSYQILEIQNGMRDWYKVYVIKNNRKNSKYLYHIESSVIDLAIDRGYILLTEKEGSNG